MSAKRALLAAVLCLALVAGCFQVGFAQTGNVCLILAYEGIQTFSNSDCDSYTVGYGWLAVSPGLIKEFVEANSITAYFWGDNVNVGITPQDAANLWLPMDTRLSSELGAYCPNPTGLVYRAKFRMDIGKLAPGTYNMYFFDTLDHPITDGYAACVDDQGEHFHNTIYSGTFIDLETDTITITP